MNPTLSNSPEGHFSTVVDRIERILSQLTNDIAAQRQEIRKLRTSFVDERETCVGINNPRAKSRNCTMEWRNVQPASVPADLRRGVSNDALHGHNSRKDKLPKFPESWKHCIKQYVVEMVEEHLQSMDKRIKRILAKRLRSVFLEQVGRALERETRAPSSGREKRCTQPREDKRRPAKSVTEPSRRRGKGSDTASHISAGSGTRAPSSFRSVSRGRRPSCGEGWNPTHTSSSSLKATKPRNALRTSRDTIAGLPEPSVSNVSCDFSLADSGSSSVLQVNHLFPDQGAVSHQLKGVDLSQSSSHSRCCLSSSPSPVKKRGSCSSRNYCGADWHHSTALSHNFSATNASDDVDVLVDVFKGRKPANRVMQLLL
uniref:Uncharacterized protein TCIL3000_11_7540 n=1 Tax=Trypanosoma congolense (strain IL3000) TaxID=1068625 RepID=G0V0Z7_TRYCI|nr:unnamed protein product [Trypanosoma congolense IL3000]